MHGTYGVDLTYPPASAAATLGYLSATVRAMTCWPASASVVALSIGTQVAGPRCEWPSVSLSWPSDAGGPVFSHGVSPEVTPGTAATNAPGAAAPWLCPSAAAPL